MSDFGKGAVQAIAVLAGDAIAENDILKAANKRLEAENARLKAALEQAKQDFFSIRSLGASDQTYIGWLRNNAQSGAERVDAALAGGERGGEAPKPKEETVRVPGMYWIDRE